MALPDLTEPSTGPRRGGLQALYTAVFGSLAWARFSTRDITA
ncbi:hypothetical protein [Streptomyces daliensis]